MKGRKKDRSQLPNGVIKWDHNSTGLDTFEKGREENGSKSNILIITQWCHYGNRFTGQQLCCFLSSTRLLVMPVCTLYKTR